MSATPSRTIVVLERCVFAISAATFLYVVLQRFVPPHPVEQPASLLPISAALMCVSWTALLHSYAARRIGLVVSAVLILAALWSLLGF